MSWLFASFVVLAFALAAGFAWYERSHPSARVLALVATLAGLAALGRIAFAPLPNVKPTTDIVLLTGYVLGGAPGFAVGAVAALASNFFFGQGPWTPWQMAAWGVAGLLGAGVARVFGRELGRWALAAVCGAAGLIYGAIMNVSGWLIFSGDHTSDALLAYSVTSIPFDLTHAVGNVLFCLAFGPALVRALSRFEARMTIDWRAAAPGAVAALVLALALASPPGAQAASVSDALRYLERAQQPDGGFGPAPDSGATGLHTGWAALGLAAAGRNPLDVQRGGKSVIDYLRANPREISDLGEINRTILVLRAADLSARDFARRDLVAETLAKQARSGAFGGRVNTTAFAVLALRAAGRSSSSDPVRRAGRWISGQANEDGGFNFDGRGGPSGVDDTGGALQALVAAGRRRGAAAKRALAFLAREQNPDGGYPLQPGGPSNAQSTAWAIQALVAMGRDPARQRKGGSRSALAYLESLVGSDGAVRYSRTSAQTPVWVTAQALTALAREPYPLAPVARAPRASAAPRATPTPRASEPRAREAATSTPQPPKATSTPTAGWAPYAPLSEPAPTPLEPAARRAGYVAGLVAALFLR